MKISDIINEVSELYRKVNSEVYEMSREEIQVAKQISEADYNKGTNITLAEYNRLKSEELRLCYEIDMLKARRDGISEVREMLMDLAFNAEVE